jgi:hypothetical protein
MPYFNNQIIASRAKNAVFSVEFNNRDEVLVGVQFLLLFAEIQIPNSYCLVVRGGVKVLSVRMKRKTADPVIMTVEGMQKLAGLAEEELDQLVSTSSKNEGLEIV